MDGQKLKTGLLKITMEVTRAGFEVCKASVKVSVCVCVDKVTCEDE